MKLMFGVPAGLLFVSTIAMGQHGRSPFPQSANRAWAHNDFYNGVLESQVDQYRAEKSAIGQAPTALAGNNMRIDGLQLAKHTLTQPSGKDFYNGVLAAQLDEYNVDNNAIAATKSSELQPIGEVPGSMAANMASDAGASGERDWYDRVVAMQAELNRLINESEVPSTF